MQDLVFILVSVQKSSIGSSGYSGLNASTLQVSGAGWRLAPNVKLLW